MICEFSVQRGVIYGNCPGDMLEFDYIKSLLCERGREDEKRHRNLEKYNYAEPVRAFVYYPVASLLCRLLVVGCEDRSWRLDLYFRLFLWDGRFRDSGV